MDEKARVERKPVVRDRVRVAAGALVAFEDGHIVRSVQQVCDAEPGDPAADNRDSHQRRDPMPTVVRPAAKNG